MKTITNLKMIRMLFILVGLCLSIATHAQVVTFPQVPNVQGCQYAYALQVRENGTSEWKSVPLYNVPVVDGSAKNSTVGYFDCEGPVDIQITFSTTVTSVEIGPASLNITPTFSGNTINFTIPGSQKFYVDINGNHYENCIHVIANPLEVNPPQQGDPDVIFIPAGTFVDSTVSVPNGQTLYIQGGAGVKGISLSNTTNTKVRGRGVVFRASFDAIGLRYADNVSIDGVLDFNHGWGGGGGCGIRCGESSNITITNTVSFSSKTWGDGYNIFSSENVTIDNVFVRTHDDAITFYGGGKSGFTGDCKKITLKNSVLLNDIAQSIHVGVYGDDYDTEIRDVNVSNIDICNWSQTPGRPAIYFTVGDKVRAANFHFDDIRVEDHVNTHLINMALVYNSTYNYGPGREIDSIYFTNVTYNGDHTPGISINGYNSSRLVKNVFFEGLEINGESITSASQGNINIGSYTQNISFGSTNTGDFDPGLYYKIKNHTNGMVLDNGGSTSQGDYMKQWSDVSSTNLEWQIIDLGNGYYKLKNHTSGMVLDGGGETENGSFVKQWSDVSSTNLEWQIIDLGNGYYKLKNRTTGLVLDSGGETENGTLVKQWSDVSSTNLEWQIISVGSVNSRLASEHEGLFTPQDTGIGIYPNPVSDAFYVKNGTAGDMIFVYNSSGKLVLQDKIGHDNEVKMGGIQPGIYFIKIKGNQTNAVMKVIKK